MRAHRLGHRAQRRMQNATSLCIPRLAVFAKGGANSGDGGKRITLRRGVNEKRGPVSQMSIGEAQRILWPPKALEGSHVIGRCKLARSGANVAINEHQGDASHGYAIFADFLSGVCGPCAPPLWPDFCSAAAAAHRALGWLGKSPLRSMPRQKFGPILRVGKGPGVYNPATESPGPGRLSLLLASKDLLSTPRELLED
jgi:hypothetical protein